MLSKEIVRKQLENFPDQFSIDELVERLILLVKIEKGNKQSEDNNVVSDNDLDKEI
ncbi:hypothetical protein [Patiriisocius sp. Uisw_017]|jgi:hypothetical protein|uniref:hypothetical protein n=1 Tax=Patiriisocius sp. Uisw_017 TaxID=3230968 RepID=UPI0039EC8071